MKLWKLAFVAGIAGFISGLITPENPLHSSRRAAVSLQDAAVTVARAPLTKWASFVGDIGKLGLENYNYTVMRLALGVRSQADTRAATLAYAQPDVADYNHGRSKQAANGISAMSSVPKGTEVSPARFQKEGSSSNYIPTMFKARIRQPTQSASKVEGRRRTPGVQLVGGLLSVDVQSISLRAVFQELGKRCGIQILGQDVVSEKVISTRFHNMDVENAIRRLMRISGTDNYALSYVKGQEGRFNVSQIVFLPAGTKSPQYYHVATPPEQPHQETVEGTIKILKKRVGRMLIQQTTGPYLLIFTRYDTKIVRNGDPVNFADLHVGDYVEIQCIPGSRSAVDIKATSA